jgi:protein-disulfide isomerase
MQESQIAKALENNPNILANAIRKNPTIIGDAISFAQMEARKEQAKKGEEFARKAQEEYFKNPLKPDLGKEQAFRGNENAKVTIIEYTDFQCPYCSRGAGIMKELKDKYKDQLRVTVKHLPLPFHKNAMIAAQYFEAIRIQNPDAAWKMHDIMFEKQDQLTSNGETFLKAEAKKLGVKIPKLEADLKTVSKKIEKDMEEAKSFNFSGTPSFLVNGVPVRGAVPADEFSKVIDRHLGNKG